MRKFCIFANDMEYTLNCNGHLLDLSTPQVMGILNATPDSFYVSSRSQSEREVAERTAQILTEGGSIIDVGACSTRPGSNPVSEEDEAERLSFALSIVRREAPKAVVSVDTYRPQLARMAVEEFGVDIINDVKSTADMQRMVSRLRVPYIYICHVRATSRISCSTVLKRLKHCVLWARRTLWQIQASVLARRWKTTIR